ncbi:histidinal/histidinol dehydrogenase [Gammaproteobacteria bacterium]
MLKINTWKNLSKIEQIKLLDRPIQTNDAGLKSRVQDIIKGVRIGGDMALKNLTLQYDGVRLDDIQVGNDEFASAYKQIKNSTYQAIMRAMQQISIFHNKRKPIDIQIETSPGIVCATQTKPIRRAGLYVPNGSAPLVSTVLMLGIPAQIANCSIRVLCSPPTKTGTIDPHILVAADLCGIDKVYKVGGAQAIAAMAYGTETIPKVDKIFGPGNSFVTQAKMLVAQDVMGAVYDMPAGPSEVMVIADHNANPKFIAADLLSQAEHGGDSQAILICTDIIVSNKVNQEIKRQIERLPRRLIAEQALKNSCLILVDTAMEAISIANEYAAEHLILQIKQPRSYLPAITCAGSIFLGPWSPESTGDYASGTNHVLPTYGFAKVLSGLSVGDFMKTTTIQELTKKGLGSIAETVKELARVEGLEAHRNAIDVRITGGYKNAK